MLKIWQQRIKECANILRGIVYDGRKKNEFTSEEISALSVAWDILKKHSEG